MKLSEEKKKELREVRECCKVDLSEFKERYNKLDKIGKLAVYLNIVDDDYVNAETKEEEEKINEKVLKFLRSDKKTCQILLEHIKTEMPITDDEGNEYNIYDGLNLYDK